jgi:hypothetical protein
MAVAGLPATLHSLMVQKQNRHDYFNGAIWNSATAFSRHAVSKLDFNLSSFSAAFCRCLFPFVNTPRRTESLKDRVE